MKAILLAILLAGAGLIDAQTIPDSDLSRAQLEQELDAYRRVLMDWGGLTVYGSDDADLHDTPGRVVFLGDEITENWGKGKAPFFPGKPYLNRGITGAVVGRHPFGGFRMSGGGTKAGGRGYLENFLFPRVIAENVMRRGFTPPEE